MNLNDMARECHEAARLMSFWDGVDPMPEEMVNVTGLQWRMILQQTLHVTTELGELTEANSPQHYLEEVADAGIVLMDLCGFIGVDLIEWWGQAYAVGSVWIRPRTPAWVAMSKFGDVLRKDGVERSQLSDISAYTMSALNEMAWRTLEGEMRKKMAINLTRTPGYGVHNTG